MRDIMTQHWELVQRLAVERMKNLDAKSNGHEVSLCAELVVISTEKLNELRNKALSSDKSMEKSSDNRNICIKLNTQTTEALRQIDPDIKIEYGLAGAKWVISKKQYKCTYCKKIIRPGEVTITGSGKVGDSRTHGCYDCGIAVIKQMRSDQSIATELEVYYSSSEGQF